MKRFYLERLEDENGISGEGRIANGVLLPDGQAMIQWVKYKTIGIYPDMETLQAVHGHGGKTVVRWIDI